MVLRLSNLLEVRDSPGTRYRCRICGNRIERGEQMIRLHYMNESAGYWGSPVTYRKCRAAHLDCWLNEDTGKQFIMGVLDRLSDRALIDLGLRVEHEETTTPEEPVIDFIVGHFVEPREPGSTSRLGLVYGMDWFGEVTRAPFAHSEHGRVIGVRWRRGPAVPWVVPPEEMQLRPVDMTDPDPEPEASGAPLELRVGAQVRILSNFGPLQEGEVYPVVTHDGSNWGVGEHGIEEPYRHVSEVRGTRPGYWWVIPRYLEVVAETLDPEPEALNLEPRIGARVRMLRSLNTFAEGEVYTIVAGPNANTRSWGIGDPGTEEPYLHRNDSARENPPRPGYWWISPGRFEVVG